MADIFYEECEGLYLPVPSYLHSAKYRMAGQLSARSVVEGGPAPNFLPLWEFKYMVGGLDAITISVSKESLNGNSGTGLFEKVSPEHNNYSQGGKTIRTGDGGQNLRTHIS